MEEKKITNPVKAIRAKCLDRCCGSSNEMDNHQNSADPLREEFETAISELTPDERVELLKMIRQRKAEKGQKYATETSRSIGRG